MKSRLNDFSALLRCQPAGNIPATKNLDEFQTPEADFMILTRENLHSIGKNGIGFNSAQLTLLGITRAQKGWLTGLIGKEIDDDTWKTLQYLKGASQKEQLAIVPERLPVWKNSFAAAKRITYTPS